MLLTVDCDGKDIVTIEGLEDPEKGLDPSAGFIDSMRFSAVTVPRESSWRPRRLLENPHPTGDEIKEAMSGNYCRCISHYTVLRAINRVAGMRRTIWL